MKEISVETEGRERAIDVCEDRPKRVSGWGRGPNSFWQWIPAFFGMPVEDEQPVGPRQHDENPWFTWFLAFGIVVVSLLAMLNLPAVVDAYGLVPAEYGRKNGLSSVSGGAHLGGALAGAFVWLVWRLNQVSMHETTDGWGTK